MITIDGYRLADRLITSMRGSRSTGRDIIGGWLSLAAACAWLLTATVATPVNAQTTEPSVSLVCMASASVNGSDGTPLALMIPADQQQSMSNRGFLIQPCPLDSTKLAANLSTVCTLADSAPPEIIDQFTRAWKISPRELCTIASVVTPAATSPAS